RIQNAEVGVWESGYKKRVTGRECVLYKGEKSSSAEDRNRAVGGIENKPPEGLKTSSPKA
ncbi:MAG: hypothetical protein II889_09300, partial [Clostridia bacterium]|nr:hypothetical protein [Clostridia bacterium]